MSNGQLIFWCILLVLILVMMDDDHFPPLKYT